MTPQNPGTKTVQIKTKDGIILGSVIGSLKKADDAMGGKEVSEFLGIPYAQPPLGILRFRPPVDVSPWDGKLVDGQVRPPACPQLIGNDPWMVASGFVETNEDCLTLNIYSPITPSDDQKLPVVVYIHHGFGLYGTASVYDATTLSSKSNAVFVVINYRLGALGFLSTEDETAPGNAGLHDILAALKWVQKYIGSLGGDANRVTVVGYGSGASLAHVLIVSEKSKGLFQREILMGGSAFNPMMSNPIQMSPTEQTVKLAKMLSCPTESNADMISCLQEQSAADVVNNTSSQPFSMTFPPVVDGDILSDSPTDLIQAGKVNDVDCIIGITQHQIDGRVAELLLTDWEKCPNKTEVKYLIEDTIGKLFRNPYLVSLAVVSEYLRDYEDDPSPCPERQQLQRFMQDLLVAMPIIKAVRHHSATINDVYLYSFDQEPKKHYDSLPSWAGTSFGDDLQYFFGFPYRPESSYPLKSIPSYRLSDSKTSLEMLTLLSNFINHG